ncbi:Vacuolar protein sorting-associated protein 41 [Tulasnella sp. 424]|nr:Vacuolar protein sorting-associated protein 41 [Tulasnella sp. 424]KAG8972308.1 Vacuolar protein sorting-associated protein 41 [Tulasnella sp. 425]
MTQPATAEANGTSETHADDTSLRLVDSPAQEASSLTNGHPPELHSAPESIAEDEESVEDDEEEDEEPVLKYEKMGGIVNEILEKDTASAIAVSSKLVALGTHNGVTHVMDFAGNRVKSYRSHRASINDIRIDASSEFVATASMDGQAAIVSLSGTENYGFDLKRPLRAIAFDPQFAKRGTRAFVCGGMAGTLVMHEKGWLGHKETTIHSNEGPIWAIQWQGNLIAWANDNGVKICDTQSQDRLMSIARPANSPRADLFKCSLRWTDDTTLIIAWADHIMLARIRNRENGALSVDVTAHFQVDCMLSGIAPHPDPIGSFLTLDYIPPDTFDNEATSNPEEQRRKAAHRPELRIISSAGEELSSDALTLKGFHMYGCNDYWLEIVRGAKGEPDYFIVVSPKDIIVVKLRDAVDHINWLVEQEMYDEALEEVEKLGPGKGVEVSEIGRKYIEYLVEEGEFEKAAKLTPRVFGQNAKDWENSVFYFAKKKQLQGIIPFVPTKEPRLSRLVYDMIIVHFLEHDQQALLSTIKEWPGDIYDLSAAIVAAQAKLDRSPGVPILMECLAELYMLNRQPGKALEYYLRLRKPHVFDLIREHNLFTVVRDQVLLLMEFDQELEKRKKQEDGPAVQDIATPISPTYPVDKGKAKEKERSKAVALLVDHTYAIPTARVVQQLQPRPYYLYLYLDALFDKDPYLAADFSDEQATRLIDFLRASNYYNLAKAYDICEKKELVPEMVFLLGRMGNNKKALNLIIEKLGDVNRAIDFAKEQNDDDLWEDLLKYSETRPAFIRGLLENVGAEIDPIRLIRRIKNGLEIPGLKEALIKILWEFNLQVSLLEGCETILSSDCTTLASRLQARQTNGYLGSASTAPQPLVLLFLCRHLVHAACVKGGDKLPERPMDDVLAGFLGGSAPRGGVKRGIGSKIA